MSIRMWKDSFSRDTEKLKNDTEKKKSRIKQKLTTYS